MRSALLDRRHAEGLLPPRREALVRARDERRIAAAAVAEADGLLREVRKHSRSILIEAFVSGQATDKVMTEADALAQLRLRTEQLAHAEELVEALRDAVAELENGFGERDRRVALAAGSRMPEFLALGERVYRAYAELPNCRLVVNETGRLLTLDDRLLHLIECDRT